MKYYQLAFNRPLVSNFTYASEMQVPIGARVRARLKNALLPAIVVREESLQKVQELQKKNIEILKLQPVRDSDKFSNQVLYTKELFNLADWMSRYYLCSLGQCLFTIIPSAIPSAIPSVRNSRELEISKELLSYFPAEFPSLTQQQQQCIDALQKAFSQTESNFYYLHGVTGSGKTEVYLNMIQHCIDQKKQALYLLPEITLLEQIVPLMAARFGKERIAILHSSLSSTEKLRQWMKILRNEVSVILGVRSAVFAPCSRLGLIIMDEENDTAYKSDKTPRYHARQIAMKRSKTCGALLLMGSATPSLENWHYGKQKKICFLSLPDRISHVGFPRIRVVSLLESKTSISNELAAAIEQTLQLKQQVILLVNKRGFSHAFLCEQCGERFECPHCSVSLTYHRVGTPFLQCHHCGYKTTEPEFCPSCGYTALRLRGWGIQRVEHELRALFPHQGIARFDSDSTRKKGRGAEILLDFYRHRHSILIGTQMIAKGINIPDLRLVGILFCDSLFSLPDFRAAERAYSLLEQAAGRASRFSKKGEVIIQSYAPENPFLRYFTERNQKALYEAELEKRKLYKLPPFYRMLRIVFRGKKEETVSMLGELCAAFLQEHAPHILFFGPAPCTIYKLAGNYRRHIILCSKIQTQLLEICRTLLEGKIQSYSKNKKVYIEIDPDPQTVM